MRLVCIESPYAGNVAENEAYLRACLADCLQRGEAPYASHGLYAQPGVLDDTVPTERRLGMEAGFAWGELAAARVVYTDRGISPGMAEAIVLALQRGQPVEYRMLPVVPAAKQEEPEGLPRLTKVTAEGYEYRICELEIAYMMELAGTPESAAAKERMERVTARYHRDYPDRPLNPKRRPGATPASEGSPHWPYTAEKKVRKPYTKRVKPAA